MRKLIKKILKENELQWINDVKSNQDIAQEIADETKIKNDLLHTPFPFTHLFLPPRLSFLPPSSFIKYGNEQYGLDNEDDINDVWERYKKLIKYRVNNINESDEWDFVRDVEAKLVVGAHLSFNDKDKFDSAGVTEVTKIDKENFVFMTDIVTGNRYADHMDDVMSWLESGAVTIYNPLKESDELQWIQDIEPYIPFEGITLNTPYGIIIQDEDAFTETIENCDEDIDIGSISYVKVTSRTELTFRDIYCSDDGVDFWQGYKECLELKFYDKYDFMMLSHWFAPDGLIQFHHI